MGIKQWERIDEKCSVGPPELLSRLAPPFYARSQGLSFEQILGAGLLGTWKLHDVREVIRQGLLGANMAPPEADRLVRDYVDERPLLESAPTAYEIVLAGFIGVEVEKPVGESQAAEEAASPNSRTGASGSGKRASTRSARRAASAPGMSTP